MPNMSRIKADANALQVDALCLTVIVPLLSSKSSVSGKNPGMSKQSFNE